MSIQTIAKQLRIDKIPLVEPIYRIAQDYFTANYHSEVVIDICTVCKSNCVYCLHQRNKLIKPQLMTYDVFCDLNTIFSIEKVKKVHLFQSGEPFLNPDIYNMIWKSNISGISVTIGTRLNAIINYDKLLEAIMYPIGDAKVEFLITIDSISKMHNISAGMDRKLVINNIHELSKLLKYKNVKFTFVSVITKVNENSMYEVRDFVKSYGFTNWYAESMGYYMWQLAKPQDLDMIKNLITSNEKYNGRFRIEDGKFISKRSHCSTQIPTIAPNGDVSICCHDMLHTINAGNILEAGSLNKIIKSEKYQKLKKLGLNKQLEICKSCN